MAIQIEEYRYAFPFRARLACSRGDRISVRRDRTRISAHEGHDHGEQPPVATGASPRGETNSKAFELVAVVSGENLEIYLDRFATNEPVTGATIEVETPAGSVKATEGADGTYRVAAPWLAKRERTDSSSP